MKNIKTLGIIAMVAIITFAMSACGDGGGGSTTHTHKFSGEWQSDATGHWQVCADDGEKGNFAEHDYDPDDGKCTTCGYDSKIAKIAKIAEELAEADGGDDADDPIELKVEIALGNGNEANSGWQKLLAALDTAGKFVDLDLSGCTLTGTFNTGNDGTNKPDGMDNIVSITLPNGITTIGDKAFSYCDGLTSVTIGNSVTTIGEGAFIACTGLTSVTIPDSVTTIGDNAFVYCDGLTSVTIPDSVTSIGYGTFADCTGLTSVTIGNSVTSIGEVAFGGCTSLTSVTFQGTITEANFNANFPFLGDLQAKYLATGGGAGTYTTTAPVGDSSVWTKQP